MSKLKRKPKRKLEIDLQSVDVVADLIRQLHTALRELDGKVAKARKSMEKNQTLREQLRQGYVGMLNRLISMPGGKDYWRNVMSKETW